MEEIAMYLLISYVDPKLIHPIPFSFMHLINKNCIMH